MSAYQALDAYFKAKDFQGHYDNVKSVHDYAEKLGNKKECKPKDVQFFQNDSIKKASKGLQNALSIYQSAAKKSPDWPQNDTELFFNSMLKSAEKHGTDSQSTQSTQKNYLNKCVFYDKQLNAFLVEQQELEGKISKHLKLIISMQKHCQNLQKIFNKIAHIPSIVTSAEQLNWVVLSEGAVKLTGHTSSCRVMLERLEGSNAKTIKECKELIKSNQLWIRWAKSSAVNKADAIKKNQKAKKPK